MKKPRSKRWSPEEAREMLRRCAESGLSDAKFEKQCGLSRNRLWKWRRRLAQREIEASNTSLQLAGGRPAPAGFVEIARPMAAEPFAVQTRSGRTIVVPPAFDTGALRQLLAIVEEVETC